MSSQLPRRTVDESLAWIKTEYFIPETNGPIILDRYQEAVLREAYRVDPITRKYIYNIIVWGDIKKSAKSSIAAAVALERMSDIKWGFTKIIGNDIKQADSRTAYYARRAIELNPRLAPPVTSVKTYNIVFPANHSSIEAIAIDPNGEAGGNDDLIIYTEAWGLKDKKDIQMWEEMRISPTKFGQGQIWVESYAGFEGESPILWDLYENGVINGELLTLYDNDGIAIEGLEVYKGEGGQLTLWNTQPRLPWQTPEYYASEEASMTPGAFQRVHRNQWASPLSVFVPPEWIDACRVKTEDLPPMYHNQPMIVVLDGSVSNDSFGMFGLTRHGNNVVVRFAREWIPPKHGVIQYVDPSNPDNIDYPEGQVRELRRRYNVVEWAYDPFQLHDMATRLGMGLGMNWHKFKQQTDRLIADKQLYDLIKEKRFLYDDQPALVKHIKNANQKNEADNKLRIVKRTQTAKIDLAVCASMGSHRALKLQI